MALLGTAALAMWWDIAPEVRADFEHWHAHEHFAERLGIPGFRRASRWAAADGGEGMFVMYELEGHEVLSSPAYLARLNAPTPWSTRLMPHHRHMVRSQCRVLESRGGLTARSVLTVRLSPAEGRDAQLLAAVRELARRHAAAPGLNGLHLLAHEAPRIGPTEEQRIRGNADRAADWVLVACGYDAQAVAALADTELADEALQAVGARPGRWCRAYALACSATPQDMR